MAHTDQDAHIGIAGGIYYPKLGLITGVYGLALSAYGELSGGFALDKLIVLRLFGVGLGYGVCTALVGYLVSRYIGRARFSTCQWALSLIYGVLAFQSMAVWKPFSWVDWVILPLGAAIATYIVFPFTQARNAELVIFT